MPKLSSTQFFVFLIAFILLLISKSVYFSEADRSANINKPKGLIFSAVDVYHLADSLGYWGGQVGVNGFLLSYIADWWTSKDKLHRDFDLLTKINRDGRLYGIDCNFIKIALG
jgi:hypothetical protein